MHDAQLKGADVTTLSRYEAEVIHLSQFQCSGDEINILSCPHSSHCSHSSSSAGVICRGTNNY